MTSRPRRRELRLTLPADSQYIRVARLLASGVALPAGFGVDEAEDLRIAVDELCSTLMEATPDGSDISLVVTVGDGEVEVSGSTIRLTPLDFDPQRLELSNAILSAVSEEHALTQDGDVLTFRLLCRRSGPRADLN